MIIPLIALVVFPEFESQFHCIFLVISSFNLINNCDQFQKLTCVFNINKHLKHVHVQTACVSVKTVWWLCLKNFSLQVPGCKETCSLYFSKFVTDPKKTASFLVNMDLHVCKVIREWLNTALTQLDATSVLLCFTRVHKTCCEKNLPVYQISLKVFFLIKQVQYLYGDHIVTRIQFSLIFSEISNSLLPTSFHCH